MNHKSGRSGLAVAASLGALALLLIARGAQAAVTLLYFTATGQAGRVSVTWATATEIDHAGFYVRRAVAADGPYFRLGGFIPAQGDGLTGWTYTFADTDVADGTTYYYELESVASNQQITVYGPVSAKAGAASSPTPTTTPAGTAGPTQTAIPTQAPSSSATPSITAPGPTSTHASVTATSALPASPAAATPTSTTTARMTGQAPATATPFELSPTTPTPAATASGPAVSPAPADGGPTSPIPQPTISSPTNTAGNPPAGSASNASTATPTAAAVSVEADQTAPVQLPGGALRQDGQQLGELWAFGFLAVFLGGFGLVGGILAFSLVRRPPRWRRRAR